MARNVSNIDLAKMAFAQLRALQLTGVCPCTAEAVFKIAIFMINNPPPTPDRDDALEAFCNRQVDEVNRLHDPSSGTVH